MMQLLLACGMVMFASLSGKVLVWRSAGHFIERNMHLMVSFAAGVFLVFAWQLGGEALEHTAPWFGVGLMLLGAVTITLLCRWLPHGSHAHDEVHGHRGHLDAHRMLFSDSVHNVGDGILLAASFAVGPIVGWTATLGVFVHEVVQEIAEFFVLRDAGYSTRRALFLNFVTSSTILVGAIGGYFVLGLFEALEGPLLAFATGGVLSVVLGDLLPHSMRHMRSGKYMFPHLFWFCVGCVLMYGITTLVPHQDPGQTTPAVLQG